MSAALDGHHWKRVVSGCCIPGLCDDYFTLSLSIVADFKRGFIKDACLIVTMVNPC